MSFENSTQIDVFEQQQEKISEKNSLEQNMENLFSKSNACIAEKTKENTENILGFEKYLQECNILWEKSEAFNSWVNDILAQYLQPLEKKAA